MTTVCRAGETTTPSFRTDRFLEVDGRWYFVTRERTREGPYESRADAGREARRYIARVSAGR